MNYKNFSDLQQLIKSNLHLLQSRKFDLIVGIPRSGMIPAYMAALYLNKKCCDLDALIHNKPLKTGSTRKAKDALQYPDEADKILLIDDSIKSGNSLAEAVNEIPEHLADKVTTLAIFSSDRKRKDVDLFFEYLPSPRLFEWNIFHDTISTRACFEIDGVLCARPSREQTRDNDEYSQFILNAPPLYIPTHKIGSVLTTRSEKYRGLTEAWLRQHGVRYDHLIMLDHSTETQPQPVHAVQKAKAYKRSRLDLMFESEREQAIQIHRLTRKPVYCVETSEMFSKGVVYTKLFGSRTVKKHALEHVINRMPRPMYRSMRLLYRSLKTFLTRK
ncbi:phosphoribosyltransferase family protein [Paenibacillus sp. 1P07SE]|uniref:phosphoribosyltransferase family protein n=1 Tax=Paenibacillus sp. 1P07SE TaxID=3132209 RepID=UPI0039A4FFA8